MKKSIFDIVIFEIKVDLSRIDVPDAPYKKSWESGVQTTFSAGLTPPKETLLYLTEKISECFTQLKDPVKGIKFENVWRNKYEKHDYQDYHIHSSSNWSFVIYESVEISRTQFINPNMTAILNQCHNSPKDFPTLYNPKLKQGDMIIFPSWLPHQVASGNIGTTISGNIKCI
jgi:hypothetical protein